jgi:hypothetical protein
MYENQNNVAHVFISAEEGHFMSVTRRQIFCSISRKHEKHVE